MFRHLMIDAESNKLLCSTSLVGKDEIVEVHSLDDQTPPQSVGRHLRKFKDPDMFVVVQSFDGHEAMGREYKLGPRCVLRVLLRNLSGMRRRKFSSDEKQIVNMEPDEHGKERKVVKAKTGSVRHHKAK